MTTPVKSNQQHIFIHDSLSEGPIQGLLYGSSSVFLNGNRLAPLSSDSAFDPVKATATVSGTDLEITSSDLIPSGMVGTPKNTNYVSLRSAGATKTSTGTISGDDNSFTITVDVANFFDDSFWTTAEAPLRVVALYNPLTESIVALGEGSDGSNNQITFTLLDTSSEKNINILRGRSFEVALIELIPIASIDSATEITLTSSPSAGNGTYTIRLTGSETSPNVEDEEAENPTPDFKVQFRNGHGIQSPINELNGVGGGVSWTGNPSTDVGGGGATLRQIDYTNTANLDSSITNLVYNSGTGQGYKTDQYPNGESYAQASNSLPSIINAQAFCGGTASNIPLLDEIRVSISYNSFIAVDTTNGDERENGAVYLFQIRKKTKVGDSFGPWRHAFRSEDIDPNGNNIPVGQVPHRGRNKSAVSFEHFIDLDFIKPFVDFQVRITRLTRHKGGAIKPGSSSYAVGGANMGGTEDDGDPTFTQGDATSTISNITGINKDRFYYPYTAHAGVFLDSREFNSVPKRSYEVRGLKVKIPTAYTPREYSSATETKGGVDYSAPVYAQFWDGSMTDDEFYTDNPAWIFYDIVTNDRFGAGEWIETSDIDVYSLYRISKYCDELVEDGKGGYEPRFRANIFLAKPTDAYKVLKDMATIFTSMVYWMDGKMTTVLDSPSDPVYNFSRANVIDGNFTYETTGNKTRANQVVVSWNNPEIGYELTTLVVEDKESIIQLGRIVKEEAVAFGCTSEGQAKRYAKWKLFTAKNQTEVVSFQAALDGAFIRPGDVINIQDAARYGAKYSGRIATVTQDNNNCVLTLDRNLNLENGTYEISVLITEPAAFYIGKEDITIGSTTYSRGDKVPQAYVDTDETANGGTRTLRTIDSEIRASNAWTSATGGELIALTFKEESYVETKSFTIADPGEVTTSTFDTLPKKNTVYVIQETVGNSPSVGSAKPYKVLGVAQDSKNIYTISAVEYYSEKYDIVDDPDSTFDIPETVFPPEAENITDPTSLFVLQNSDATRPDEELRLQWEYPAVDSNGLETGRFLDSFEIYNNIPGQEDRIITGKRARTYTFTNVPNGTYTFRVRSISVSGKLSNWVTARYVVDDPFTDNVNRVKGIQTEGLTTNFPYITNHIGTNRGVYDTSGSVTYNANDIVRDGTNGSFYFLAGSDSNVGHVSVSNDNSNSPGTWRAYEHGVLKFTDESSNAVLAPSRFRSNDTVSLTAGYSLNCSVMATLGSDFPGVPTANPKAAYVVLDHSTQALKLIKATFDDNLNLFYWQDLNQYSPTDANAVWTSLAGSATVAAGSNKVVGTNTTFTSLNNLNKLKFDDGTVVEGARVAYIESDTVLYLNKPLDSDNGFSGTVRVQQYAPDFRRDVIIGQVFYNTTTEAYKFVNFLTLDPSLAAGRSVFLDTNTAYVQFDLKETPEPILLPDELIVDATATGYEQPLFKITYNTADSAFEAEDTGYSAPSGNNPFKYEKTIYIYDEDDLLSYGSGSAYEIQVDVIEGKDPGNSDKYSTDTLQIPKVEDVAAGTGAKFVNLQLEDYTVIYDKNGANPSFNGADSNITLTAVASEGFADPLFQWSIGGTVVQSWYDPGAQSGSYDYAVPTTVGIAGSYNWDNESGGSKTVKIEVAEKPDNWDSADNSTDPSASEAEDSDNILAVRVGSGGIAISLTNDSHVVPCDKDGDPKTFANSGTNIEVFSGGVPLDFVTTLPSTRVVGQWTVSASPSWNTGSTQVGTITSGGTSPERYAIVGNHTFEGEVGNGLDNTETVTYTIVIPQEADNGAADLSLTRKQTFSLGLDGQDSTTPGADGTDARSIKLSANQYVIKYTKTGGESDTIDFTTEIQGVEDTAYYVFSVDGVQTQPASGNPLTTSTFTLPDADEPAVNGAPVLVQVDLYEGTTAANAVLKASDSVNIYAVQDGSDSITGFLTNAAHVVSADKDGNVSSFAGAGGTFRVFLGSTNITTSCTFSLSSGNSSNFSINQSTGVYSVSGMSGDQETATFQAVIPASLLPGTSDITITADYSISKSRTGADGASVAGEDGDDGEIAPRVVQGFVYSTQNTVAPDAGATATTYTFSTGAFANLNSNWSLSPPSITFSTETTTYYAPFSAVEGINTTNNTRTNVATEGGTGTAGTLTFGSVAQGTVFTGLVTFREDANNGDILQYLGSDLTEIYGGYIKTGTIEAAALNLVPVESVAGVTGSAITSVQLSNAGISLTSDLGSLATQSNVNLATQVTGTLATSAGGTGSAVGPFGYSTAANFISSEGVFLTSSAGDLATLDSIAANSAQITGLLQSAYNSTTFNTNASAAAPVQSVAGLTGTVTTAQLGAAGLFLQSAAGDLATLDSVDATSAEVTGLLASATNQTSFDNAASAAAPVQTSDITNFIELSGTAITAGKIVLTTTGLIVDDGTFTVGSQSVIVQDTTGGNNAISIYEDGALRVKLGKLS